MGRRPENIEGVILALEIFRRIPRHRKVTADELHKQLEQIGIERDIRTIQRQLEKLSDHFGILCDNRSKPYGYSWRDEKNALSLPTLSLQESLLLNLAEQHLRSLLPPHLMRAMDSFFTQASINLKSGKAADLEREWTRKIRMVATSQPLLPPKIDASVFETVADALYHNHWLNVHYKTMKGKEKQGRVMPLGLAQQGNRFYLVCRFEGYSNERTLAIHRIFRADKTLDVFTYPEDFDLAQYDNDGRFGFGEGKKMKLVFDILANAGNHLYETPLSADQVITELEKDYLCITATVTDSDMLDWWLNSFGQQVRNIRKIELEGVD